MIKQRLETWRFGGKKRKKKKSSFKILGIFVICWWGSPTSIAKTPACALSISFVLKSTLLIVRYHCLKASQGIVSQDNKFKVALNMNHLKVDTAAYYSLQIGSGKSSKTDLFLSHLFQCSCHCLFYSAVLQVHPDGQGTCRLSFPPLV